MVTEDLDLLFYFWDLPYGHYRLPAARTQRPCLKDAVRSREYFRHQDSIGMDLW